jgi:hypothetical protein
MISSLTEHTRKCLKLEYLGRIEYNVQKSRVTGSWDHKDSVSAKKVFKKNSCLCTFKQFKKSPFIKMSLGEYLLTEINLHIIYSFFKAGDLLYCQSRQQTTCCFKDHKCIGIHKQMH